MRKTFAVILILASVAGFGQKGMYLGIGGFVGSSGIVNQNAYGNPELDYEFPFSYGFSLNVGYGITDNIGAKMEIGYARLGQKYSDVRGDTSFTRDIQTGYLTVPVLFKYNSAGKTARFYFCAGPEFAFLLSAEQEYLADGSQYNRTMTNLDGETFNVGDPDIQDRVSSIDIMARVDMGVDISLTGNLILNAGLTMNYGLTDLNAPAYRLEDYSGNYNPSHNFYGGITMGLNYRIPIGK